MFRKITFFISFASPSPWPVVLRQPPRSRVQLLKVIVMEADAVIADGKPSVLFADVNVRAELALDLSDNLEDRDKYHD
ncbi:MAG: hypothetical protein L0287_04165 [Anaerolineae bacterium]|nr:hypothetical protein [Anaerolineae bacterium]